MRVGGGVILAIIDAGDPPFRPQESSIPVVMSPVIVPQMAAEQRLVQLGVGLVPAVQSFGVGARSSRPDFLACSVTVKFLGFCKGKHQMSMSNQSPSVESCTCPWEAVSANPMKNKMT
jgi:hypothetical protein